MKRRWNFGPHTHVITNEFFFFFLNVSVEKSRVKWRRRRRDSFQSRFVTQHRIKASDFGQGTLYTIFDLVSQSTATTVSSSFVSLEHISGRR